MKKNNFFRKYKIYIIISTLALIWAGFIFFVILPSVKVLQSDFDAVQMKLLDVKVNNEKLGKISTLKEEFEQVNKEKNILEVIFSKNNIVELVKELEIVAQQTGNTISISVDEENKELVEVSKGKAGATPKADEFVKMLPTKNYLTMNIKLVGDYNSLIKFINKLNNIRYYNSIASFKVISEKISIEDADSTNNFGDNISVLSVGSVDTIPRGEKEKEKLILSSNLSVIFYSSENNNETK